MDASYLKLLPSELQRMVEEVESAIGNEIVVRSPTDSDPDFVKADSLPYCQSALTATGFLGEIVFSSATPPVHHLAHEVMHIHRSFVQLSDRLCSKVQDGGMSDQIATGIDNDFEHFRIVPIEMSLFPEAVAYWESHYAMHLVTEQRRPSIGTMNDVNAHLARFDMLRNMVTIQKLIPHWHRLPDYAACLQRQGVLFDAQNLLKKLDQQPSKASQSATMLRFAKIDRTAFQIARFSLADREEIFSPIPQHS
jgi:hypothetical protein